MTIVVDIGRREWYADVGAALANGVPRANLMEIDMAPPAADDLIFLVHDADGEQLALSDPGDAFLWGADRIGVEVMTFAPAQPRPTAVRRFAQH